MGNNNSAEITNRAVYFSDNMCCQTPCAWKCGDINKCGIAIMAPTFEKAEDLYNKIMKRVSDNGFAVPNNYLKCFDTYEQNVRLINYTINHPHRKQIMILDKDTEIACCSGPTVSPGDIPPMYGDIIYEPESDFDNGAEVIVRQLKSKPEHKVWMFVYSA